MPHSGSVLVTGGASGIGLALVEELLKEGWRVVASDVVRANIEAAQQQLAGYGNQLRLAEFDVADEPSVVEAIAAADRDFGPLKGVVNCAGIARDVPALETSAALFRKILDVNLVGTFLVAREAAKAMKANGGGSIVNIASVSGQRGNLGRAAYGSSKAGVILLTQVMAVELATANVRVNAIAPGPIETPLVKALHTDEARAAWMQTVPMKRYAAPTEVSGAIAFLLDGEKSGFVTGQTIGVDGGFLAGGLIGV